MSEKGESGINRLLVELWVPWDLPTLALPVHSQVLSVQNCFNSQTSSFTFDGILPCISRAGQNICLETELQISLSLLTLARTGMFLDLLKSSVLIKDKVFYQVWNFNGLLPNMQEVQIMGWVRYPFSGYLAWRSENKCCSCAGVWWASIFPGWLLCHEWYLRKCQERKEKLQRLLIKGNHQWCFVGMEKVGGTAETRWGYWGFACYCTRFVT